MMPSFRLLFSIWKIPASKVSRTRPPYWLAFVWLRLRREKWKRCVRTYGCWVKFVAVVDGIFTRCPQSSFPSVSWRSLCLLGGHLLTQGGNSLSARVFHVNSSIWLVGSPVRYVLKIHFFIEFGLKMIQFKIQFKTKSKIFIQKNIHSKQNPKYSFKKIFIQ